MFPSDLTEDPLLARSDKLVRWGAFVPTFGFFLIGLTGRLVNPSRATFVLAMLCLSAAGQLLVWWGMNGLRRSRGWAVPGVLFYIWAGGVLTAIVAATTAVPAVVPIPLLPPLVATFAKRRMRQTARRAGVTR